MQFTATLLPYNRHPQPACKYTNKNAIRNTKNKI